MKMTPLFKKLCTPTLCLSGMLVLFVACSSTNTRQPAKLTAIAQTAVSLKKVWDVSLSGSSDPLFYLAAEGEFVYAATTKGIVVKVDAVTGKEIWQTVIGERLSAAVSANQGKVVVAAADGTVHLLDAATGKQLWTYDLKAEILKPPVFVEGLIIVHANNNRVYALDSEFGKIKWQQQHYAEKLSVRAMAGLLVVEDKVILGYPGGRMLALKALTGAPLWDNVVSQPTGSNELERVSMPVGIPRYQPQQGVCSTSFQGRVACVALQNGEVVWSKPLSSATGVALEGDYVYATDEQSVIHGMKFKSQDTFWKQDKLLYRDVTVPVVFQNSLIVGDKFGFIHVLSKLDGHFLNRIETDGSAIVGQPIVVTDRVVVQTKKGNIFAYKIEEMQ